MEDTKKLKVIQLTTFFYPVTGGVETQVEEIARELLKKDIDVRVFTSDSSRNNYKINEKVSRLDKISIYRFRTWFSLSKFHKFFPGIIIALLKADFDVLHIHGIRKPEFYLGLLAAKLKGKRVVVTTHNPFTADIYRSKKALSLIKLHDATIGRWLTRFVDTIIYISPDEREILKTKFNLPEAKLKFIPNGINDMYFNKNTLERYDVVRELPILGNKWDAIVLAACRMNEVKGLQKLKYAVDNLPQVLFLFIGGDDGYLNKLKSIYRNNPNVFLSEKYLKKELLRGVMNISSIFVLPSLHEPFGLTIAEAAAAGLPVIATSVGGPKKVLDKAFAYFIDPNDQVAWKQKIEELIYKRKYTAVNASVARKFVSKYRWKNIIPEIIDTYL